MAAGEMAGECPGPEAMKPPGSHPPQDIAHRRLLFADLLRGLAMIVMIEVHAVNALMHPVYREAPWFAFVDFINGLVAPVFLFVSGFAFLLGTQPHLDALRAWAPLFWKILGRIGLIWLIGYLLHIPFFSLRAWRQYATPEQWLQFFSIDVLQCIACGLLLILILRLIISSDRLFSLSIALLGCAAVLPAAWLYRIDLSPLLPVGFAVYLNPVGSTLFPLLPWFGFMAAGVLVSRFFLEAQAWGSTDRYVRGLLQTGLILALAGLPLFFFLKDRLGVIVDERPHILFFAIRLGCVLVLFALCSMYCRGRDRLSPLLIAPSRETLMVYFVHLQVLYRPVWEGQSLVGLAAQRFSFTASLLLAAGLILVMLVLARAWHIWKQSHGHAARNALAATIAGGAILFLLG